MSVENALAFLEKMAHDEDFAKTAQRAAEDAFVLLGKKQGLTFNGEDLDAAARKMSAPVKPVKLAETFQAAASQTGPVTFPSIPRIW